MSGLKNKTVRSEKIQLGQLVWFVTKEIKNGKSKADMPDKHAYVLMSRDAEKLNFSFAHTTTEVKQTTKGDEYITVKEILNQKGRKSSSRSFVFPLRVLEISKDKFDSEKRESPGRLSSDDLKLLISKYAELVNANKRIKKIKAV